MLFMLYLDSAQLQPRCENSQVSSIREGFVPPIFRSEQLRGRIKPLSVFVESGCKPYRYEVIDPGEVVGAVESGGKGDPHHGARRYKVLPY